MQCNGGDNPYNYETVIIGWVTVAFPGFSFSYKKWRCQNKHKSAVRV